MAKAATTPKLPRTPKPPKAELTGVVAISDTRRRQGRGGSPQIQYNPDELVRGRGLRIYDEMLIDEQVKACDALVRAAIIGPGWTLEPSDESDAAVALRDALKADLDALPVCLDDTLWEVLSARSYGFSLTEQVWSVVGDVLTLTALRPIAPHGIDFLEDGFGGVTGIQQQAVGAQPFPPGKFLHFVCEPAFGNPYGTSSLRPVHRPWFYKKHWVQWFAIYGEKLADAPIVSVHPKNTPDEKVREAQRVLDNLQARTVLSVPEGWSVSTLTDTRDIKRLFIEAIDYCDRAIAKGQLVPDKLGVAGAEVEGGSYSLGETQFDVFLLTIALLARRLAFAVQRQVIDRMVLFRQPGAASPIFKTLPASEDDRAVLAKLWLDAVNGGAQVQTLRDVNHFRGLVKFPDITQDELDAEEQRKRDQAMEIAQQAGGGGDGGGDPPGGGPSRRETPATREDATAKLSRAWSRALTTPERRADLAQLAAQGDAATRSLGERLGVDVAALAAALQARVARVLSDGITPTAVRDLTLNARTLASMRQHVERALRETYAASQAAALAEVRSATTVAASQAELASRPGLIGGAAERFFRAKSFWVTGVLESDILKAAQAVLFNAVKGDKPARVVLLELSDALKDFVPQTDAAGRPVNVPARLETIARTNLAEAANEARYATFTDPDLAGVVEALQYSAILDDRTRESHAAWDGVVKPAAWWMGPPDRRPPAGFSCRCTLLPVLAGDDMPVTPDAQLPSVEFPDKGFK